MRRVLRFALLLVTGLALLTWAASGIVDGTTRSWFEKDLALRARLVRSGSERQMLAAWRSADRSALSDLLTDIARDERIMSAAACGADLKPLAATKDHPTALTCGDLGARLRRDGVEPTDDWHATIELPGGDVHASVLAVVDGGERLGFIAIVHDLSFVTRREATMRRFMLVGFGVLAVAASVLTTAAARWSWRGWSNEMRSQLRGERASPEFQPLMRDVRELVERIAREGEAGDGGAWTAERLKRTLSRNLHGERIVIVANREPYIHQRAADGSIAVVHPASGLVTALEPVMRACSGVWVAHGSGTADRETVDRHARVKVPPGEASYSIRRVWLKPDEEAGYYYGFSNEGLWPLCHVAHTRPNFRIEDWKHYEAVNQKFAEAVCEEVDRDDPIVLVQDYHFALAPRLIRERLPRATIISFWHIPWPNAERLGICPWKNELLEGLLGSSIVGFHIQAHCNNFVEAVERYMEARVDREQTAIVTQGRPTLVRAYPISIEWPSRWLDGAPSAAEQRASVFAELGLAPDALLGVGVDRLDYTKGIEERLLAVERALERFPTLRGRFTFVQLAAPSRTLIERYRELNETVEALAERINRKFGHGRYRPIILLRAHHEPPTVFRFYRAADVCYVSSLHDGMNLVAKEFVSARDDERGVLVLSSFTGAARELTEALVVNPYALEEASSALLTALHMPLREQQERMRAMRALVAEFNVYRWAGRMLVDAARLRRRVRTTGRLSGGSFGLEDVA